MHDSRTSIEVEARLEFETLLVDLSSRFINLPSEEVDRGIEEAMRRICGSLSIDFAVLWQWSVTAPGVLTPTHFHYSQDGLQPPEPMRQDMFPWYTQQMLNGRTVGIASLEDLPAEAAVDRESCRILGIQSNLTLPLTVGDEPPIGALGLNTLRRRRDWPDELVNRLRLVAQIFTNALARRRHELARRESEERLSLAADSAEVGLWTLDFGTRIFWATERARTLFGYAPDEEISMERFEASVYPDDRDLVRGAIERSARTGESIKVDYRITAPDSGGLRWISSSGRPRFKPTGELECLMGVSMDITRRKNAADALRMSEKRLEAGVDLAGLSFYNVDFVQGVTHVNDRFQSLCGIHPESAGGHYALNFWLEHLHPDDRPRVMEWRQKLHAGEMESLSIEYRFLNPIRGERWINHLARVEERDAGGQALKTYGVLRDITEQKRVENDLRDLSQRLIRAQEDERALLARELHDDVTQRLAVLAINLGRIELATPDGAQAETMRELHEGLTRLSEDIHTLAYQLHPSVLDELGLAEALRTECERRNRQWSIDFSVDLDPLPDMVGKDAALCLFRVAQEALNNVIRHAGASAACITLRQQDGWLLLTVRDDGAGFDPAVPATKRSLGLLSMRERVQLANGMVEIESAPGRGTAVVARVPAEGGSP